MAMSLTVSPMRALHRIKAVFPEETFLDAFAFLFQRLWRPPHVDLTKDENLRQVLLEATSEKGQLLFTAEQVEDIMGSRDAMKGVLKAKTEEVVKLGAFGAPWLWVTNSKGESQAFFGSDR
jgi:glutathione S-transferase kappa 1